MFLKKIFTSLLIYFLFAGSLLAQTMPKNEVSAEIKDKAAGLSKSLAREAEQFALPFNRVWARMQVADLVWDQDEKLARDTFQNAISELNQMLGEIPLEDSEVDQENYERYAMLADVKSLRSELLLKLAARDPKFALDTLQLLKKDNAEGVSMFEDDAALEASLAVQVAVTDPKQAYEIAKKNIEGGFNYKLFSSLEELYAKDAEIGAKLAQDILNKIKSRDTTINSAYDTPANTATNTAPSSQSNSYVVNVWDIQSFLDSAKKLNRLAEKNKKPAVLSDSDIKGLIEILAQKYVRQPYLSAYEVSKIMPEVTKYFPAQAQALRAKVGQQEADTLNNLTGTQIFLGEIEDKSAAEILQIIEKKPVADRDELYWQAAQKFYTDGAAQEAKRFYGKMKTKREYDYLDKQINDALPLSLAETGDMNEVRRMMAKMKTPDERIEVLSALAIAVLKNGDKKTANALLEESRSFYSGKMKNRKNLSSILQLAQAYAIVEPEQGFPFLESNINYFNDIISAAILLDEFNDIGSVKNDELRLDTVQNESYRSAPKAVPFIRNLAAADFDRTVGLADKFTRPEARFFARYRIAAALLDPKAEEFEKNFQVNYGEEGDH